MLSDVAFFTFSFLQFILEDFAGPFIKILWILPKIGGYYLWEAIAYCQMVLDAHKGMRLSGMIRKLKKKLGLLIVEASQVGSQNG